jgi:hypothetical protein
MPYRGVVNLSSIMSIIPSDRSLQDGGGSIMPRVAHQDVLDKLAIEGITIIGNREKQISLQRFDAKKERCVIH